MSILLPILTFIIGALLGREYAIYFHKKIMQNSINGSPSLYNEVKEALEDDKAKFNVYSPSAIARKRAIDKDLSENI